MGGFYTSWSAYGSGDAQVLPEDLDPSLFTRPIYAFATIADNFTVQFGDPQLDPMLMPRFTAVFANNPCATPMLSIGGAAFCNAAATMWIWPALAATPASRHTFTESVIAFSREYGFKGVDLVSAPLCLWV